MAVGWDDRVTQAIEEICAAGPVVPVIEIEDAENARPLAEALVAGGIHTIEITLRTPQALDAIKAVSGIPNLHVGAGTLITAKDVQAAKDAGATFGVSPGSTPELLEAVANERFPFLPGAATPSEVANLITHGFQIQKFFPAEAAGGIPMLKAVGGPLQDIRFCPTGGVSPDNASDYLSLKNVICVGGSWVAPKKLIAEKAWDKIEANAREASKL